MNRLILLLVLFSFFACDIRRNVHYQDDEINYTVGLEDLEENNVDISMAPGKLEISSTTEHMMESNILYNIREWKPEIDYHHENQIGKISLRQPRVFKVNEDFNIDNKWNIKLNKNVPLNLTLNLPAGESNLKLEDMNIRTLDVSTGAGEFNIDLRNSSIPELIVKTGVGEVEIDLSGNWTNNNYSEIKGGIGELTIYLPKETGVRVRINGLLGEVSHELNREGKIYTNDAYHKSNYTLDISVSAGIGEIKLKEKNSSV